MVIMQDFPSQPEGLVHKGPVLFRPPLHELSEWEEGPFIP
jgi:hypothetical protein